MSGHGHDDGGLDQLGVDELRERLSRAQHAVAALQRLTFALKELVPRAFEEGFKRRLPDQEEPWLVDWLMSDTKRALEPLLAGRSSAERGGPS